jgi:hypothetical protein
MAVAYRTCCGVSDCGTEAWLERLGHSGGPPDSTTWDVVVDAARTIVATEAITTRM